MESNVKRNELMTGLFEYLVDSELVQFIGGFEIYTLGKVIARIFRNPFLALRYTTDEGKAAIRFYGTGKPQVKYFLSRVEGMRKMYLRPVKGGSLPSLLKKNPELLRGMAEANSLAAIIYVSGERIVAYY